MTTTTDAALLEASEEEHLAFALGQGRVIFTHDQDFLRLHATGLIHAGIAYARLGTRTIQDIVSGLALLHDCLAPDELRGRVEFL